MLQSSGDYDYDDSADDFGGDYDDYDYGEDDGDARQKHAPVIR